MTAQEAAEAAGTIKPQIAIPMHYGVIVGNTADAETFKKLVKCEVETARKRTLKHPTPKRQGPTAAKHLSHICLFWRCPFRGPV